MTPSDAGARPRRATQAEVSIAVPDSGACLRVHRGDLGSAIRHLRQARHLTIETLALDAGMHPTYLSGIERGIRNPTFGKLVDLAEVLEVPVSIILSTAEERCTEEAIRIAAVDAFRAARADARQTQYHPQAA
jgi:transcriptional regulator with XRE-family HTH domain